MGSKNLYHFSGAIKLLEPVKSRNYTNKKGEACVSKERIIVVRNKTAQYGRWKIVEATFHCTRDAVEMLETMIPGLEVIVEFSISSVTWTPKGETDERYWQKLECQRIMSPTDKTKPLKWWLDEHNKPSTKKKSEEETEADKPVERLTDLEDKRRRPETEQYDVKNFDKTVDYSNDDSKEIKDKGFVKPQQTSTQDDLPF